VLAKREERRLLIRMLAWRLLVTTLKHPLAIGRLVALTSSSLPSSVSSLPPNHRIVELAALACRPRLLRSRDNCLDRSLLAYRYLLAAGASPSLVIGFERPDDAVLGHAWLLVDGRPVGEPRGTPERFTEIVRFPGDCE